MLLREEDVSIQRLKTWKTSRCPDYAAKQARFEYRIRWPTERSYLTQASPKSSSAWTTSVASV